MFLAQDPDLGRQVALKVPRIEMLSHGESWRRFQREVWAASRLDHANLVPILEAGRAGPAAYIVSVFVDGPSLADWMKGRDGPASHRMAARLVATLARAMEHAHLRNILHLDLKPANVLLHACERTGSGDRGDQSAIDRDALPFVPRICDFGLARLMDVEGDESQTMLAAGSPPYMAPEQAESRKDRIGPATDVYGLGAILYELLTGRPPFGGKSLLETLRRVVADEPVAPRSRRPGVPRDLNTICLKCLAKLPGDRYAGADALADDLERYLEVRPIQARPASPPERAVKWCRRHPAPASSLMVTLIAVMVGFGVMLQYQASLRGALEQAERGKREALEQERRADGGARMVRQQWDNNQVRLAQEAIDTGRIERGRTLLDTGSSGLNLRGSRGFAWMYLDRMVRDRVEVFTGHRHPITSLALSPDGRFLASGDHDGVLRFEDRILGRGRELSGRHEFQVWQLEFSPNSRLLASSVGDRLQIDLWNMPDGSSLGRINANASHCCRILFSPDSSALIGLRTGPAVSGDLFLVAAIPRDFGSSGWQAEPMTIDRLVRLGLRDERLQPLADLIAEIPTDPLRADDDLIRRLRGSRPRGIDWVDGSPFVLIADGDGTFEVIKVSYDFPLIVGRIRDQDVAIVRVNQEMGWSRGSPAERSRLDRFIGHFPPVSVVNPAEVVAYAPAAHLVARYRKDLEDLAVIDTETGKELATYRHGPLFGLGPFEFSADGRALAFGSRSGMVRVWHMDPPRDPGPLAGHSRKEAWSLAFSPDGTTLASSGDDAAIRLWDSRSGQAGRVLFGHISLVTSIAYSPTDSRTLASGGFDRTVRLWDSVTGECLATLSGHEGKVFAVAFSADGRTLASASDDRTVQLWDVATRSPKRDPLIGHRDRVYALAFHSDGRILASGSLDKTIRLWDVETRECRTIEAGEQVLSLAFSPDGHRLASSHEFGAVKIWDVETDVAILSLPGHSGNAYGVTFSPDGRCLVSCGDDRMVRVWDPITGQELLCLAGHEKRVNAVAFSPDGHTLASADHTGAIRLWRRPVGALSYAIGHLRLDHRARPRPGDRPAPSPPLVVPGSCGPSPPRVSASS